MGKMREYIKECIKEEVQLTIATLIKIRQENWQDYYDALFHEERKALEKKMRQNLQKQLDSSQP